MLLLFKIFSLSLLNENSTSIHSGTRFTRTHGSELEQLDLEVLEKEFDTEEEAAA